ncbi:hypothetical protein EGM51_02830 [Verrucomicrobia bacterium S94]|nr:hypothetical protein EGM51_02830 [Verrucomicrobia bacterium S94]
MKKLTIMLLSAACAISATYARPYFDTSKDLLICQYDSKPDPDDIHAQAAAGCMLAHADHAAVNYFAVQGAYGVQGGTFIESGSLFSMAFGVENTDWTDAHSDWWGSVTRIKNKAKPILQNGGKVWVAEAGQSNITADWIAALISDGIAESTIKANVIVVQHSDWNQDQTADADLAYVKDKADYYYIDNGNGTVNADWADNGPYDTPKYNSADTKYLSQAKASTNPNTTAKNLWTEADYICDNQPYHPDWSNITPGGVDFSDTVEIWWILNVQDAGWNEDGFWAKYVTNTPDDNGGTVPAADRVDYTALPDTVSSAASYNVNVPYSATTDRDIVIEIWDTGWRGSKTTTVSAGSGTINVTVPVYNGTALTAGTGYIWKANIRPVGTDWTQNISGGGGSKTFTVSGSSTGGGTITETPTQDAYIQGSTVFNDTNLKVEPNYRVSYLKFDVDGITGTVSEAKLVFQLTEAGSGTVRVYQGNSNLTWTENTLTAANAPGQGAQLGSVTGSFANGSTVEIDLGTSIGNGEITFVVTMDGGGNDIWASSSEGVNSPYLEVTYQ